MDPKSPFPVFPMHFRGILLLAGMYTLAWSAIFNLMDQSILLWLADGNEQVAELSLRYYGGFGVLVGLLIFFSAFYPISWVYLILAGITGKIILAIWFALGYIPELGWNKRTGFQLIFNEVLWIIPLITVFLRGCQVKNYLAKNPEQ
ncbi:hypothetical protein PBT90_19010 [Algoriphagus halophytocola]|uniref:DUF4345 domain-containing protein n=1 Tax=Algoriphagus halophytocola TaxID=2991499 RepID=A0ABY6MD14_9BACT|nr:MULTISPECIES: hypothetical protein [unclassified Algoriphagus]UZD21605.1 hypothetical protein OM944_13140 [Algoriphagus sp. TR-M5]WBL42817.1 hypothetical protein PBT90_19010 [Algoriphagus sp. TR-M9]